MEFALVHANLANNESVHPKHNYHTYYILAEEYLDGPCCYAISVIDVCDVAAAHIAAMENSDANGNRYNVILSRASKGVATLRLLIGNEFQSQGYKITSKGGGMGGKIL